jgi:tetratricopeptide (TPR) repeat protein
MAQGVQLNAAGQYVAAAQKFNEAVKLRDDVPALWIARARNQVQMNDYGGAFASYRNALDQDRSNREALDAVAQLSLATNDLERADTYASQILALDPGDLTAKLMRATVSYRRGRLDEATATVDLALAQDPSNEASRVLKSRILQRRGDSAGALAIIAPVFEAGSGGSDLRRQLVSIFEREANGRGLLRVAERNARDRPRDAGTQIDFAMQLLLNGRVPQAARVLNAVGRFAANDAARDRTVAMLIDADLSVTEVDAMLATLPTIAPSLATAAAQHAIALGRGDRAVARLAPLVAAAPLTAATTDLHAAYALALAQVGQGADAGRRATAILAVDPAEPRALAARALAQLAARDINGALRDARVVVRDNPGSPAATALLAQVYRARRDPATAAATITGGFNDNPEDSGFLKLYVEQLVAADRVEDAIGVARAFSIRHPASVLTWRLRAQLCTRTRDTACVARARAIIDRLRGRGGAMPQTPAEEEVAERELPLDMGR